MTQPKHNLPADAVVTAKIEIIRYMSGDHDAIAVAATDAFGDDVSTVEALGLLALANDTIIASRTHGCSHFDEDDEDDDDE